MSNNISSLGTTWTNYKETRMTPDERNELKLKADLLCEIIEARQEKGIRQKELEALSGH